MLTVTTCAAGSNTQSVLTDTDGKVSSPNVLRTYDIEVMLGKVWVLLQESAEEHTGVLGCVCVICDVV